MSAKTDFIERWMREEAQESAKVRRARDAAPENSQAEGFQAPPMLVPFADMDFWYLSRPLTWTSDKTAPPRVVVPLGFTTDFASIPSVFWSTLPKTGRYGLPAIVHDWLYWEQAIPRSAADTLFDTALGDLGVALWQRTAIYRAVWAFGGTYWDTNTTAKARGEGRVLKQFPEDAKIAWNDWRARPGVFV